MVILDIDHHLSDSMNIFAVLVSIAGFLYLTREFFKLSWLREVLRWVLPTLLGILILAPIGIAVFDYFNGPLLRGAVLYGSVGAMIGFFNGAFVEDPRKKKKPREEKKEKEKKEVQPVTDSQSQGKTSQESFKPRHAPVGFHISSLQKLFEPRHALIGFLTSSFVWFIIGLVYAQSLVSAVLFGGAVGLVSAAIAGFWRSFNLESPYDPEDSPPLSKEAVLWHRRWRRLAPGLARAVFVGLRCLGVPKEPVRQAFFGIRRWEPCSKPGTQRYSWCAFSWKRGLIGLALGGWLGVVQHYFLDAALDQVLVTSACLALAGFMAFGLWHKAPRGSPTAAATVPTGVPVEEQLGTAAMAESEVQQKEPPPPPAASSSVHSRKPRTTRTKRKLPSQEAGSSSASPQHPPEQASPMPGDAPEPAPAGEVAGPRPSLFSAGGFYLGLVTALLLGFLTGVAAELVFPRPPAELSFGRLIQESLSASLTAASFIGLPGAIIGAFSRYLFWWVESIKSDQHRLGAGAIITLIGFCLQLLPLLIDLLLPQ